MHVIARECTDIGRRPPLHPPPSPPPAVMLNNARAPVTRARETGAARKMSSGDRGGRWRLTGRGAARARLREPARRRGRAGGAPLPSGAPLQGERRPERRAAAPRRIVRRRRRRLQPRQARAPQTPPTPHRHLLEASQTSLDLSQTSHGTPSADTSQTHRRHLADTSQRHLTDTSRDARPSQPLGQRTKGAVLRGA